MGTSSRLRSTAAVLLLAAAAALAQPAAALDGGRYGEVRLAAPPGQVLGYVVLFSDRGGWTASDQAALLALAGAGALAVGVDLDVYLARIAATAAECDQLVGDAEGLSRQLQRRDSGAEYYFPILAGSGAGGMLAAATLAQAPVNTLAGAVSIDPVPWLPGKRPLCAGIPSRADRNGFRFEPPPPHLNGFWVVGVDSAAGRDTRRYVDQIGAAGAPFELQRIAGAAPGDALAAMIKPRLAAGLRAGGDNVAALPLIELPVARMAGMAGSTPAMAILLSGDGGWRDLDKAIAEQLQRAGVPVVGWDSVRYFWTRKTPQQTAADLGAVIEIYRTRWHADRVALIGYSFGANVLPFAYDLLPAALRQHIVLVALLGLEARTDWEIQVSGWLGAAPSGAATPVAPVLARMPAGLIQCFYGADERDTLCPSLAATGAEVIRTTGSHHFDGDYARLAQRILERLGPR